MEKSIIGCYFYKKTEKNLLDGCLVVAFAGGKRERGRNKYISFQHGCKWQNANKMHIKCGNILLRSLHIPRERVRCRAMLVLMYVIYFYFYNLTKYFNI
jgi:hypothetical protein